MLAIPGPASPPRLAAVTCGRWPPAVAAFSAPPLWCRALPLHEGLAVAARAHAQSNGMNACCPASAAAAPGSVTAPVAPAPGTPEGWAGRSPGRGGCYSRTDLRLCRYFGLSDGWWLRAQLARRKASDSAPGSPSPRGPQPELDMLGCGLKVLVRGQQNQVVSATGLDQQRVSGPDLHSATATRIPDCRRSTVPVCWNGWWSVLTSTSRPKWSGNALPTFAMTNSALARPRVFRSNRPWPA